MTILGSLAIIILLVLDPFQHAWAVNIQLHQSQGPYISTPARLQRTLAKYGLGAKQPISRLGIQGVVNMTSAFIDVEYIGIASIGTPPQEFRVSFDTGSADIWIPDNQCTRCGLHNFYDPLQSSTAKQENIKWIIKYGDRSAVEGVTVKDTIHLGDIRYPSQRIGLARNETPTLTKDSFLDGIFGLAFSSISRTGLNESAVQTMFRTGAIKSPVVGVWMGRTVADNGAGELVIGIWHIAFSRQTKVHSNH
ncbi:aspartic peptidase domain-containing protein [Phycomyces nitens]|nr:aspartic peptidase domain-containing protein [Phycomyces nitens]